MGSREGKYSISCFVIIFVICGLCSIHSGVRCPILAHPGPECIKCPTAEHKGLSTVRQHIFLFRQADSIICGVQAKHRALRRSSSFVSTAPVAGSLLVVACMLYCHSWWFYKQGCGSKLTRLVITTLNLRPTPYFCRYARVIISAPPEPEVCPHGLVGKCAQCLTDKSRELMKHMM